MEDVIIIESNGELKVRSSVDLYFEAFARTINLGDELKAYFNKFLEEDNIIDDR